MPYEPEIFSKTTGSRNIKKGAVWVCGHLSGPAFAIGDRRKSEFFKTFTLLYHPGVWILAAASFLEKAGIAVVHVTENLHLVYIAGWTFLVAGMIVLVVILRGSRM